MPNQTENSNSLGPRIPEYTPNTQRINASRQVEGNGDCEEVFTSPDYTATEFASTATAESDNLLLGRLVGWFGVVKDH